MILPVPVSQDTTPSNEPRGYSLASALCSAAPLIKVDKSHVLKTYIRSQKTYKNHFIQEGRKDWAAFDKVPDHGVDTARAGSANEKGYETRDAGFGTPTLKARVPEPPVKADKEVPLRQRTSQGAQSDIPECLGKERMGKGKVRGSLPTRHEGRSNKLINDDNVPVKSSKKRERSIEPDREAILADRRKRRRANKAVVNPKQQESDSESDEATMNRTKSKKKDKKTSLASGLALMHGFSAENLGRGRLTIKPSFGVFQRGKASAKTKAGKVNAKDPNTSAWSEQKFLGEPAVAKAIRSKEHRNRGVNDGRSVSSGSSSHDASPPKGKFKISNHERRKKPEKSSNTKYVPRSLISHAASQKENDVEQDTSTEPAALEEPIEEQKAESTVWDIECGILLSEVRDPSSFSKTASSSTPRKTAAGTLVLDTTTRWNLDVPEPTEASLRLRNEDAESGVSYASLCPSQSASQAGRRIVSGLRASEPTSAPVQSKYFGPPSSRLPAVERTSPPLANDRTHQRSEAPSPPPLTHIGDSIWVSSGPPPDTHDTEAFGAPTSSANPTHEDLGLDVAATGQPDSRPPSQPRLHNTSNVAHFVSARTLPRYPSSDDSLADLDEFLHESLGQHHLRSGLPMDTDSLLVAPVDASDDGLYQHACASSLDHVPEYNEVSEATYSIDPDTYSAECFGHSWSHLDGATPWTNEDAEHGPPLCVERDMYANASTSPEYLHAEDICSVAENPDDEDNVIGTSISWDPDVDWVPGDEVMYDDTVEMVQGAPLLSGKAGTCADFTEASSPHNMSDDEEFREGPGLILHRDSMENRWSGAAYSEGERFPTVSRVEEDVAKGLRNHWLPQRL